MKLENLKRTVIHCPDSYKIGLLMKYFHAQGWKWKDDLTTYLEKKLLERL